jgi:hypothetical protein
MTALLTSFVSLPVPAAGSDDVPAGGLVSEIEHIHGNLVVFVASLTTADTVQVLLCPSYCMMLACCRQ